MLYKVPFFVGNLMSCFVPGSARRGKVRAYVNRTLLYPAVRRFIRKTFNVRVRSVRFVRQITLGRIVFVVNDEYYVKVFRDVSNKRLQDHRFLMDLVIREFANNAQTHDISIPEMIVAPHAPMYVTPRVPGRHLNTFTPQQILQNQDKIQQQAFAIIDALRAIDVSKIPDSDRFRTGLQPLTAEQPTDDNTHPVLAHFDLNRTNFLFDEDLNIISVIDWDGLSIAKNPDTDIHIFMKYWTRFIAAQKQKTVG